MRVGVREGQGAHVCVTLCPPLLEAQLDKKVFPSFSLTQNVRALFLLMVYLY